MDTITFTSINASPEAIAIVGNIIYGTDYKNKRLNQVTNLVASGKPYTLDSGITVKDIVIKIKGVTYDNGKAFRDWIKGEIVFSLYPFSVTVPAGLDLGFGKGVNISSAWFLQKDEDGVFQYKEPGIYNINFPIYTNEQGS